MLNNPDLRRGAGGAIRWGVFSITVETEFCAAHALSIAGARETLHGHNFHVWATMEGKTLDGDGLLCDFHTVQGTLREIIEPLTNRNLHDTQPFKALNPTAENIARYIADALGSRLAAMAGDARVASVRVSEAPGCVAAYTPA